MSGNTISMLTGFATAGAQAGVGLAGLSGSRKLARSLDELALEDSKILGRESLQRRGLIRVQAASSRGGTADGGVDVNTGSIRDAEEADVIATEFAIQRAAYNFAVRRERILAEGRAEATAGFTGGFMSSLQSINTLLDLPLPTPKPNVGTTLMDMGIDPSEAPLLTGIEPPLFSFLPDTTFNMDF